jgi:BRCA1/BRCA2-containing complex subunit 3
MDPTTTTPKKVNVPLIIAPNVLEETKDVRELYIKLPEHMHEEHKKEFLVSNDSIKYDLRFTEKDQNSLPNKMTELYNAGVYGQLTTSLVDNIIIPATHVLDLEAIAIDKKVWIIYISSRVFHFNFFFSLDTRT